MRSEASVAQIVRRSKLALGDLFAFSSMNVVLCYPKKSHFFALVAEQAARKNVDIYMDKSRSFYLPIHQVSF